MWTHYLKIALRNLLKYKAQTAVCVCGLAAGFISFALSLLWVRHETTFDQFHPDAERLYLCCTDFGMDALRISPSADSKLVPQLNRDFPEIERATAYVNYGEASMEADSVFVVPTMVDENFSKVFHVEILEGSPSFWRDPSQVAISRKTSTTCFGDSTAIGRTVFDPDGQPLTVGAVLEDWPNSNISIDVLRYHPELAKPGLSCQVVLKTIHADTDLAPILQRINERYEGMPFRMELEPLTSCRSTVYSVLQPVRTTFLKLFVAISALIILAVLANTCSFLAGRIPRRMRELAIRKVCGATNGQLAVLLLTEFLCLLAMALLLGFILLELLHPWFCEVAQIRRNLTGEVALYFLSVSVLSTAAFFFIVWFFSRRTLQQSLRPSSRAWLPRLNLIAQLAVAFFILFCGTMMGRQLHYLSTTMDVGWERKDRIVINSYYNRPGLADRIARLAGVKHVCPDEHGMLCANGFAPMDIRWEGQAEGTEPLRTNHITARKEWMDFWRVELLQGHCPTAAEARQGQVMINETAMRAMGWVPEEAIGKRLYYADHVLTVAGVVKDFHISAPTVPVDPCVMVGREYKGFWSSMPDDILVACMPEQADSVCARINDIMREQDPWAEPVRTVTAVYDEQLASEQVLLRLILLAAGVCSGVALFCVYAFVTLVCEQRRKEIAIRKVNGATAGDIFGSFIREYLACLAAASIVAFPLGYMAVRRWQEQYVEQLPVGWGIYFLLFLGMTAMVTACVGGQVWRAAQSRPTGMLEKE